MRREFTYHINLNERGSFYADVRNDEDNTIFEIKDGLIVEEEEVSIFEDGYMKHPHDMKGLCEYLVEIGLIEEDDYIVDKSPNER